MAAKIIFGCAAILAYALPMSASESEPKDNESSEEVKNKQVNSNTSKNARLPSSCALTFMENCITGPYVTASFAMVTSEASGTSNNTDNYSLTDGSSIIKIDVTSNYNSNISIDSAYGVDIGLGYDLGGLRAELVYNYSHTTSGNASINGSSDYLVKVSRNNFTFPFTSSTASNSFYYSSQRVIASLAFDIPTGSRLAPYFSGGIGPAWVSVKSTTFNTLNPCINFACPATFTSSGGTGIALALQAKAGLSYFISPRTSLFVEAVYDYTSSLTAGNINLDSFGQYSAKFGFRYKL